jgi:hypothetical protein
MWQMLSEGMIAASTGRVMAQLGHRYREMGCISKDREIPRRMKVQ